MEDLVLIPPIAHPLAQYKLLLFDADGTLRRCLIPSQPCPNKPGEWELLPNVQATLARYDWTRHSIAVISNQGGVGLGFLSLKRAEELLLDCLMEALRGVPVLPGWRRVFLCPHVPTQGCTCRKPMPWLLVEAMSHYRLVLRGVVGSQLPLLASEVLYVGDQATDMYAAVRAGIAFVHAADFFGWPTTPPYMQED